MKVKIDSREQSRVKPALDFFEDAEVHQLQCADYLFIKDNKTVGFEYKTIVDFIGSVKDGRVFRQAYEMKQTYDKSFILVSGDESQLSKILKQQYFSIQRQVGRKKVAGFTKDQYYSALARLYADYNVITSSGDFDHACYLMKKVAEKCFDEKDMTPKPEFKKTDNPALNYLMGIRGISKGKAMLIIDEFDVNTLQDLLDVAENCDISTVKGIGGKTADKILEAIK